MAEERTPHIPLIGLCLLGIHVLCGASLLERKAMVHHMEDIATTRIPLCFGGVLTCRVRQKQGFCASAGAHPLCRVNELVHGSCVTFTREYSRALSRDSSGHHIETSRAEGTKKGECLSGFGMCLVYMPTVGCRDSRSTSLQEGLRQALRCDLTIALSISVTACRLKAEVPAWWS